MHKFEYSMSEHIHKIYNSMFSTLSKVIAIVGFCAMFLMPDSVQASHLVGGDLTYRCLGNNMYEVVLNVRRDCNLANPDAVFDDPASIGIFDFLTEQRLINLGLNGQILIPLNNDDTLNQVLISKCTISTGDICVHQTTYRMVVELPFNSNGYLLTYERCCRNGSVQNVSDPLNTGMTVFCTITPKSQELCNNSPTFDQWAPIYICSGMDVQFDHGATDLEGDSIVYKLCTPLEGASRNIPRPQPPFGPPYDTVDWNGGGLYSRFDMLGNAADPLRIDLTTGMLNGTPEIIGQFVVGICMEEYRDGELLSTIHRDFQYNVRDCVDDIIAGIDAPDEFCGMNTGTFINTSQNVDSITWYPDVENEPDLKFSTFDLEYTYPGPGTYTVRLIAGVQTGACFDTIDHQVTIYAEEVNPVVLEGIPDEILTCFGEEIELNPSGDSTLEYNWSPVDLFDDPTSFNPTIIVDSPMVVTVMVRDPRSNCRDEKQINIRIPILETLNMIPDSAIGCIGQTVELNPNGVDEGYIYTWSPADRVSDPNAVNPTIEIEPGLEITVMITDTTYSDCSVEKTIIAFDILDLALGAIPDTIDACPGETVSLNTRVFPELVYEWSPAELFEDPNDPNPSITVNGETEVYVTVSNPNVEGCIAMDTVLIRIGVIAVIEGIGDTIEACINSFVDLNPTGNPEYFYTWGPAELFEDVHAVNPVLFVSEHTEITVLVEDTIAGCSAENDVLIYIPILDAANNIPDTVLSCFARPVELNPGGSSRFLFEWSPADLFDDPMEINPTVQVDETTTFFVLITDTEIDSCTLMDTVTVFVPPIFSLSPNFPMDTTLCQGDSMALSVNLDGAQVPVIWTDQNGNEVGMGTDIVVMPSELTIYTVTAEDEFGCSMSEMTSVQPGSIDININYTLPSVICAGDTIQVMVTNNKPEQDLTYMWSPADQIDGPTDQPNVILRPFVDTDYILKTTNQFDCERYDTVRVMVKPFGPFEVTADPPRIILGQTSQLGTVNDPTYTYMWEPPETLNDATIANPVASPTETTTYKVKITDPDGCMFMDEVTVEVEEPPCEEPFLFIPNAFTPNNDGSNDILFVRGNTIDEIEFMIYNRWGQQVFRTTNPSQGWDGTFNDKNAAADVFGYYVWIRCTNGDIFTKKGNISLLR